MTITDKLESKAPVYRYYTVDLLTDEILAEIPFGGVSYENAVKGAGSFQGRIPVLPTPANRSWNLYESTMPGQTGLYVMRNGVCVWGGIIWSRTYDLKERVLSVDASEFTSYLYHRRIWKTWSHQYGAKVIKGATGTGVFFDYGTTSALQPGSTVKLEFYDPADFKYNGYYKIAGNPAPTTNTFYITGNEVSGKAAALPNGSWDSVTVSVRSDTYDYIRSLVQAVFKDFTGIDFPNQYIEPGLSYKLDIVNKALAGGYATITTEDEHDLSIGQSVQVENLGPLFDGEYTVTDLPTTTSFRYVKGGNLASTAASVSAATIVARSAHQYEAVMTTSAPHGMIVGQVVTIDSGEDVDGQLEIFNGEFKITEVPTPTTFKYYVLSPITVPKTTLTQPTATVGGTARNVTRRELTNNTVTLTTSVAHGFSVGNSVTVANVNHTIPISQKSLDAASDTATIETAKIHDLQAGDTITISGLHDAFNITRKEIENDKAIFTTYPAHTLGVGDSATISDMVDAYSPTFRSVSSNVATITFPAAHNMASGNTVSVENIRDYFSVTGKALTNGVATLTLAQTHGFKVNDIIEVGGVIDTSTVISKSAENGIAIITTSDYHNMVQDMEVTVTGLGEPFDGTVTILSVTPTRIFYEIESKDLMSPTSATGTVSAVAGIFNGSATLQSVTSNTISYIRTAADVPYVVVASGTASGLSPINGTRTLTGATSTTVTFAATAPNMSSTEILYPVEEEAPKPTVSRTSIHNGTHPITAITRNTFTVAAPSTNDVEPVTVTGMVTTPSLFNVTNQAISSVTGNTIRYPKTASNNVLETTISSLSLVKATSIFNGTYTITAVPSTTTLTYTRTHKNVDPAPVSGYGTANVRPTAIVSTFGPFPGSADIGIKFSSTAYSGTNVEPTAFRGFELTNVGEALDKYSDTIDGFEYRIDCSYNPQTDKFERTFVLIPINFPNPPAEGEVSPISRFGADKLVFEWPGNISAATMDESAEDSATRFFAIGETDLGPDAGPQFAVAADEALLSGKNGGRRWPLLDDDEKIDDVDNKTVLHAYAQRYLSESRPPGANLNVTVNGSLQPVVGSYKPGDWCSLIIDDEFVRQRLQSDMEPRDTVIVRKIDSIKVSVPDSVTTPETVNLTLVPEWEVDKSGK